MVGIEQSLAVADDAVAIGIGVARKGNVEPILEADHPRHGVRRRRVHADLAVPVDGHEAEGRVDRVIDDLEVQAVAIADSIPIGHAGAAQWIDADT